MDGDKVILGGDLIQGAIIPPPPSKGVPGPGTRLKSFFDDHQVRHVRRVILLVGYLIFPPTFLSGRGMKKLFSFMW
jgi:hypothetical protein